MSRTVFNRSGIGYAPNPPTTQSEKLNSQGKKKKPPQSQNRSVAWQPRCTVPSTSSFSTQETITTLSAVRTDRGGATGGLCHYQELWRHPTRCPPPTWCFLPITHTLRQDLIGKGRGGWGVVENCIAQGS